MLTDVATELCHWLYGMPVQDLLAASSTQWYMCALVGSLRVTGQKVFMDSAPQPRSSEAPACPGSGI